MSELSDPAQLVDSQRRFFYRGDSRRVEFRRQALLTLRRSLCAHEADILAALRADLNKSAFEAYTTELGMILSELDFALRHLRRWARPRRVATPLANFPARSYIYAEPYGVTLIIAPWNYPFQLVFCPLIAAIAAGNCAVCKPSDYAPASAALIERIINECFAPDYVAVRRGGRQLNQTLLEQEFDYIFFTGSSEVGRSVARAAAEHLTPVTLELGGKSPCIVDSSADLTLSARRIIWGKLLNAGQTCVAPDYVLVQRPVRERLIAEMHRQITLLYGAQPLDNPDYPRIVNRRHFERLTRLIVPQELLCGGESDEQTLRIAPTLLQTTWDSPVMQEEIFGPLLPLLAFDNTAELLPRLQQLPRPLACYIFTQDRQLEQRLLDNLSFGGGCVNDSIVHLLSPRMPFGGVGHSGQGCYHGEYGFRTFSHQKSVVRRGLHPDVGLRYPPFDEKKIDLARKFM